MEVGSSASRPGRFTLPENSRDSPWIGSSLEPIWRLGRQLHAPATLPSRKTAATVLGLEVVWNPERCVGSVAVQNTPAVARYQAQSCRSHYINCAIHVQIR